jgi:glycerol-3-phosphate acyltransferase PlsY
LIEGLLYLIPLLVGSIPFGVIVARFYQVDDLQSRGSGNIGATNVSRVLGFWPAGAITFTLDFLKGALPVFVVGLASFQSAWANWVSSIGFAGQSEITESKIWAVGLCAVVGHCFSPWMRFKGGKGVATGIGVLLVLSPVAGLAGLIAFGLTFREKKTGSLASLSGLMTVAIVHWVFQPPGNYLWFAGAIVFLILIRHDTNIDALLQNRENAFH